MSLVENSKIDQLLHHFFPWSQGATTMQRTATWEIHQQKDGASARVAAGDFLVGIMIKNVPLTKQPKMPERHPGDSSRQGDPGTPESRMSQRKVLGVMNSPWIGHKIS